jgi:hypothetical protein
MSEIISAGKFWRELFGSLTELNGGALKFDVDNIQMHRVMGNWINERLNSDWSPIEICLTPDPVTGFNPGVRDGFSHSCEFGGSYKRLGGTIIYEIDALNYKTNRVPFLTKEEIKPLYDALKPYILT